MPDNDDQKVITGRCRFSYVHLFEPYSNDPDKKAKYSLMLLVPKTDTATIAKIERAQQAALEAGKSTKFGGKIPNNWKTSFRDGDEEGDLERNPEMAGHMFITISSSQKPGIIDRDRNPIEDSTEVYSGCYGRVSMRAFPYSNSGNKGVSFGLNHVQKLADGDYLGGRSNPEDDFDELSDDGADVL